MRTVNATIERGINGTYDVNLDYYEDLTFGLLGQGSTVEEAKADFYNSYKEMGELYAEQGKDIDKLDFVFNYDTPSFLQYYANVFSLAGLSRITGINQGQLSHYLTGHRNPSVRTVHKIQERIHSFANELSNVRFV